MLDRIYPILDDQSYKSTHAVCNFEFDASFGQVSGGSGYFEPYSDTEIVNHLLYFLHFIKF